jgi:hypothetical protein
MVLIGSPQYQCYSWDSEANSTYLASHGETLEAQLQALRSKQQELDEKKARLQQRASTTSIAIFVPKGKTGRSLAALIPSPSIGETTH